MSKHAFTSKTILFNLVVLAVAKWAPGIDDSFRQALALMAISNLGLRFGTSSAVRVGRAKK